MRYRVFYRTAFDDKCPARPDYDADYQRGSDVEAVSWANCAEVAGQAVALRKGSRLRRPLEVGDVLVAEDCDTRILTPQGIWARVPMPKQLTERDFEPSGR